MNTCVRSVENIPSQLPSFFARNACHFSTALLCVLSSPLFSMQQPLTRSEPRSLDKEVFGAASPPPPALVHARPRAVCYRFLDQPLCSRGGERNEAFIGRIGQFVNPSTFVSLIRRARCSWAPGQRGGRVNTRAVALPPKSRSGARSRAHGTDHFGSLMLAFPAPEPTHPKKASIQG